MSIENERANQTGPTFTSQEVGGKTEASAKFGHLTVTIKYDTKINEEQKIHADLEKMIGNMSHLVKQMGLGDTSNKTFELSPQGKILNERAVINLARGYKDGPHQKQIEKIIILYNAKIENPILSHMNHQLNEMLEKENSFLNGVKSMSNKFESSLSNMDKNPFVSNETKRLIRDFVSLTSKNSPQIKAMDDFCNKLNEIAKSEAGPKEKVNELAKLFISKTGQDYLKALTELSVKAESMGPVASILENLGIYLSGKENPIILPQHGPRFDLFMKDLMKDCKKLSMDSETIQNLSDAAGNIQAANDNTNNRLGEDPRKAIAEKDLGKIEYGLQTKEDNKKIDNFKNQFHNLKPNAKLEEKIGLINQAGEFLKAALGRGTLKLGSGDSAKGLNEAYTKGNIKNHVNKTLAPLKEQLEKLKKRLDKHPNDKAIKEDIEQCKRAITNCIFLLSPSVTK